MPGAVVDRVVVAAEPGAAIARAHERQRGVDRDPVRRAVAAREGHHVDVGMADVHLGAGRRVVKLVERVRVVDRVAVAALLREPGLGLRDERRQQQETTQECAARDACAGS